MDAKPRVAREAHDNGLYLRKSDLEGFEKYQVCSELAGSDELQYHGLDTSPLSIYVMKPFWNFIVDVGTRERA